MKVSILIPEKLDEASALLESSLTSLVNDTIPDPALLRAYAHRQRYSDLMDTVGYQVVAEARAKMPSCNLSFMYVSLYRHAARFHFDCESYEHSGRVMIECQLSKEETQKLCGIYMDAYLKSNATETA